MSDTIDKDIHEQIMGKCWHDLQEYIPADESCDCSGHWHLVQAYDENESRWACNDCNNFHLELKCKKCGDDSRNPSYLSWEHYGPLLEKVKEHEKWQGFIEDIHRYGYRAGGGMYTDARYIKDIILNPSRGRQAIWEFFIRDKK